jgi:RNA polymerase sigma-70 factor (ECF subfamily)
MGPRSLERRFDRFRRQGDPAALASVFDATAAEILKVASHLARDPAAAEDLLQRTFLTAIEVAPTWDRSRRLLPWLLGILANHAKEVSRRAARLLDPTRLATHETEDPAAAASRREEGDAARSAIDELPDPARSILVLRYRHGLDPSEIALALALPPATVRSHLHRGIQRVREKVPGALVGVVGVVGIGGATRGLAEIRRVVLARAAAAGAEIAAAVGVGAGGLVLGGLLVGKKALAVAVGLLLLLGGTSYLIVTQGADGDGPAEDTPSASVDTERRGPTLASPAGATGRRPTTDSAAAEAVTDPAKGALEVRVLARDGAALPEESFAVLLFGGSGGVEYRFARTGADGRGRLDGLEPGGANVCSGHGPTMELEILAGRVAQAEIRLPRGLDVEGVVVDPLGSPVVGAEVRIDRVGDATPRGMLAVTRSKADGHFAVQDVHPGSTVSARAVGYAPSGCRRLQSGEGQTESVRLVLGGRGASVRGRVRDAGGSPVAGALVTIGDPAAPTVDLPDDGTHLTSAKPFEMLTADDGTFAAEGLPVGKAWVVVTARGQAPNQVFRDLDLAVGPPPNDWTITLSAAVAIEGVVVDESESPVERVAVWTNSGSRAVTDAQGRFRFDVLPSDPPSSLRATHYVKGKVHAFGDVKAGPLGSIVRLVLHPSAEIRVRVVDERGDPISNRSVFAWTPMDAGGPWVESLTDSDGRATLPVGLRKTYEVYVTDPEGDAVQPSARLAGAVPGVDGLTLTVRDEDRPTGKLIGRLTAPDGRLPDGVRVSAIPSVASLVRSDHVNLALDAASGRFESRRLQPGRYEVSLTAVGLGTVPLGRVRIAPRQTLDLGETRLDPPGSLVVKVLGPEALVRSRTHIRAEGARGGALAKVESDGTARFALLWPGRYWVVTRGWQGSAAPAAAASGSVVIESGRETSLELTAAPGHVRRIRVQGLATADVPGSRVLVHAEGEDAPLVDWPFSAAPREGDPEAKGVFAPGRYVAEAETADGRRASVSFEVRGEGEPPVVLSGFK